MEKGFPTIPGFEMLKLVGKGGMGAVYLARQQSLNRPVAVKILPAQLAENPAYVMRFQQEARAAAKVKHPGLVQIYDAGEYEGLFYYVMEFINGETTAQRVQRKGRLDEESALVIAESVAVALEHAWDAARLVHRDIKPDNILIDGDGAVKVADLGLAKLIDQTSLAITISHALIGTPHYCSPEQARGESQVDCRADIYALGATLYHFVVGQHPFSDASGVSAMVRSLTEFVPDPMDCHPGISGNTAWLIEKMMARDRNDRQRNWHEALDDIDQVMQGKPPLSPPLQAHMSVVLRSARRGRLGSGALPSSAGRCAEASGPGKPAPTPLPAMEEDAEEEAAPAKASRSFRVFLALAAVLTVVLYLLWFRMEKKGVALAAVPPPAKPAAEKTVVPQNPPEDRPEKIYWKKRMRRLRQ